MNKFQEEAILTVLKKMFNESHFNICTVDKCLEITKAIPNKVDYDTLSLLHCVNWNEMSQELRDQVFEKTLALIADGNGFNLDNLTIRLKDRIIDVIPQKAVKKSAKKRFKLLSFRKRKEAL